MEDELILQAFCWLNQSRTKLRQSCSIPPIHVDVHGNAGPGVVWCSGPGWEESIQVTVDHCHHFWCIALCIPKGLSEISAYKTFFKKETSWLYFILAVRHAGSQFPDQGSNPCPLQWNCRVLTTGPPGNSLPVRCLNDLFSSSGFFPSSTCQTASSCFAPPRKKMGPRLSKGWSRQGWELSPLLQCEDLAYC